VAKKGPSGEGTVRWHKSGLCEARLPIPKHLRAAYGGKSYLSFYDRQEGKALEKRAAARRKTGKHRPVHLFPEVVTALKAHRKRYLEERVMHAATWESLWAQKPDLEGLVFPSIAGGIMLRSNLGARHFKPVLAKAGLPKEVRLYDLRHTFATLWVESGEDLKVLQEVLGHSRYETTANRYVHPSRRAHKEAMARFGERFRRPS
jgi:integrase